jgi:aminopeptidase N
VLAAAGGARRCCDPTARSAAWDGVRSAVSDHPFHAVRGGLARELVKHLAPADAATFLAGRAAAEADPRALRQLCTALGALRTSVVGPAPADALLGVLSRPMATWQLEGAALAALGSTRDPRAVGVLRAALGRRSWGDHVRCRALEGLAETEDPAVVDDLLAATRSPAPDRTRAAAAAALARLAEAREALRPRVVERLVELLAEPGFRTQNGTCAALGRLRDESAIPALSRVHRTAPDGRTRRSAYEALAAVRKGASADEAVARLQRRLEELGEENAKLRGRVDRLERA